MLIVKCEWPFRGTEEWNEFLLLLLHYTKSPERARAAQASLTDSSQPVVVVLRWTKRSIFVVRSAAQLGSRNYLAPEENVEEAAN